ncbi:MAG: hypothetical protein AAF738_02690 [Bacteroidota bacterium]
MKIGIIHRITALTMAVVLFVTSTGFSIDVHYCKDKIKSIRIFGEALSCHKNTPTSSTKACCHSKQKTCELAPTSQDDANLCEKNCCSNKTIQIDNNQNTEKQLPVEISPLQIQFLAVFVQVFVLKKTKLHQLISSHLNYIPPLLNRNIPVLIQSFLL